MTNNDKLDKLDELDDLKLDQSKNNGLITKIWGEHMWESIHSITFGYPVEPTSEDRQAYRSYFMSLRFVLPCKYCRDSYSKFVDGSDEHDKEYKLKITDDEYNNLSNRDSLTKWGWRLHNRVNFKLGVDYRISYDDMCNKYESYRAKCLPNDKGCNMPLHLKANSYMRSKIRNAPVIDVKLLDEFKIYAKMRGVEFDDIFTKLVMCKKCEHIDDQIHDRLSRAWLLRDKLCWKIINKMRLEGVSSLEVDGDFFNLPTKSELQLMNLVSSNICCKELGEIIGILNKNEKYINYKNTYYNVL
jgi:hypothetical protein